MCCYFRYFTVLSEDTIVDSDAIAIDFGKQVSSAAFGGVLAILVVSQCDVSGKILYL